MPSGRRSLTRGSQVSRLVDEIDERVNAFLSRPIEGEWPYVWIDATHIKAREAGRIVSTATIVAVGVNADGRRPRGPPGPRRLANWIDGLLAVDGAGRGHRSFRGRSVLEGLPALPGGPWSALRGLLPAPASRIGSTIC
jgi:hypothetical protein